MSFNLITFSSFVVNRALAAFLRSQQSNLNRLINHLPPVPSTPIWNDTNAVCNFTPSFVNWIFSYLPLTPTAKPRFRIHLVHRKFHIDFSLWFSLWFTPLIYHYKLGTGRCRESSQSSNSHFGRKENWSETRNAKEPTQDGQQNEKDICRWRVSRHIGGWSESLLQPIWKGWGGCDADGPADQTPSWIWIR